MIRVLLAIAAFFILSTPALAQGAGVVTCQLTAAPTTTTFSAKCLVEAPLSLTLALVTAGLSIGPANAPVGTVVQVTALPQTQ